MTRRVLPVLLTAVGAALVTAAAFIPYGHSGSDFAAVQTQYFKASIGFGFEPFGVTLGTLLVVALVAFKRRRLAGGILAAVGVQTILLYLGYVWAGLFDSGSSLRAGGFVGVLGGALIGAAALILLLVAEQTAVVPQAWSDGPGTQIPAGWYPDPTGAAELRYWDGRQWTSNALAVGPASTPSSTHVEA